MKDQWDQLAELSSPEIDHKSKKQLTFNYGATSIVTTDPMLELMYGGCYGVHPKGIKGNKQGKT